MAAVAKRAGAKVDGGGDVQLLVHLFRVLTEEQFDFWIDCLNRAAASMGVKAKKFTRDDRQKTISYWYLLMFLLEIYAADRSPFDVKKDEVWLSEGLVSMKQLTRDFRGRFKEQTIRRYVFDLKARGLIALKGRGANAMLQLTAPAILALADTIRQWIVTFREVDQRVQRMATI